MDKLLRKNAMLLKMRENEKLKKYHFVVFDLNKLRQSALFSVRIEDRKYKVFVVGDF